uniref:Uncharacterized protein n=1 Tax=Mola mola TaxID=94237 RepID=A0A3Q3XM75_MOLML
MANRAKFDAAKAGHAKPCQSPEPESATHSGADDSLLADNKTMMEDMRSDIISKVNSGVTETVNRVVPAVLEPIKSTIEAHSKTLADLERSTNGHSSIQVVSGLKYLLRRDNAPMMNWDYRILRPNPRDGTPPRPLIVRVCNVQDRNRILCRASELSPLYHDGHKISIFPDCP